MRQEPVIAVGLVERAESVTLQLLDDFITGTGIRLAPGEYRIECREGRLAVNGPPEGELTYAKISGIAPGARFRLPVTIGIDFHWQQRRILTYCGALSVLPLPGNLVTVINEIPLEAYILSVSCSEMSADAPEEFLKAHSIISRSWLLAQLALKRGAPQPQAITPAKNGELLRWYDRQSHSDFDVCADDHCQRYQGIDMITNGRVSRAVEATRGQTLVYDGKPCDARFSKCCGGVTEDFRLAWSDIAHPYLVPLFDGPSGRLPDPPLSDEQAARDFIAASPDVYCNCADETILGAILTNYDRTTRDFFRWRVRLTPEEIAGLLKKKLDRDLGRIIALEPIERGCSARIKRLRLRGENAAMVIGKELEIRRALSPAHLYSSAFAVDVEGPAERPAAFVLSGAGWGHGVGLCQIGAAVMACRGIGCGEILRHYYPGGSIERWYA